VTDGSNDHRVDSIANAMRMFTGPPSRATARKSRQLAAIKAIIATRTRAMDAALKGLLSPPSSDVPPCSRSGMVAYAPRNVDIDRKQKSVSRRAPIVLPAPLMPALAPGFFVSSPSTWAGRPC